jgi:hypothetical protein
MRNYVTKLRYGITLRNYVAKLRYCGHLLTSLVDGQTSRMYSSNPRQYYNTGWGFSVLTLQNLRGRKTELLPDVEE